MFRDLFPDFARSLVGSILYCNIQVEGGTVTIAPSSLTSLVFCAEDWEYSATLNTEEGEVDVFDTLTSDYSGVLTALIDAVEVGKREKEEEEEKAREMNSLREIAKVFMSCGYRLVPERWADTTVSVNKRSVPELGMFVVKIAKDKVMFTWGASSYLPAVSYTQTGCGPWSVDDVKHHQEIFVGKVKDYLLESLVGSLK